MKSKSRLLRRLTIIAALAVLFTLLGFFALPPLVKSQLEQRLSATLGRRVTVEKVRLNPYALTLTLENFAIREADGTSPFLGWRRLYVNFEALASIWDSWVLGEIALDGFDARVAVKADQTLNFSDVIARLTRPESSSQKDATEEPARPILIRSLKIGEATVQFADGSRPAPFATTLGPVTFAVTEFRTVSERGAPYRFEAVTESGEKLTWSGTLQAEPLRSTGELSLENILLPKYAPYYADRMQADIVEGVLAMRGHYDFSLAQERVMKLRDGVLQLRGIKVRERTTREAVVDLPALDITGVQVDALAQKAAAASIVLTGGQVRARREKDGSINLVAMLQPPGGPAAPAASPPATPSSPPAKLPDVTIGEFALKDFSVRLDDLAASRPTQLALNAMQLSVKNITLAEGAEMPLQLAFDWSPKGTVRLDGTVVRSPLKAKLKTELAAFELLPLSPYLEEFVNARITGGVIAAQLDVDASLPDSQPLAASIAGDVTVEKLGVVDGIQKEELAGFAALRLRGLRASTAPETSLTIEEIQLAGPLARVIVDSDGALNLATIAKTRPAVVAAGSPPPDPNAATPGTRPPKIEIGKVVVTEGDFRFTDRSLKPNASMAITQFGGTISGLSSTNPAKADVDLKALVDGAGPVAITGKLDPLGARTAVDLKVDFKNVDLLPLSPYSGKYAGYELARGKLAVDVKMVVDGPKIDATNVITLHQFTFGSPVQSPEATKLPVRLGVALLKDADGKIVIDVPIQGSTEDPEFRIGRVVLRVVVNLLTKAAVSPFALLGSAFGGGGDELGFQEFTPGSAEIQESERKKLETMVQALQNRPALAVDFEGSYDAAADTHALKRSKLAERIRRAIWEAKHLADPNIPPPAELVITPEETVAMTRKLYDEQFPPGTEFGAPLPPPPPVTAPPPPPRAGLMKRVIRTISFQSRRDQRAAEQESERLAAEHAKAVAAAAAVEGPPLDEMTGRLAEAVTISDDDLKALGQKRAEHVRDYFVTIGKISPERLFLAKAQAQATSQGKGPRVFLHLQ